MGKPALIFDLKAGQSNQRESARKSVWLCGQSYFYEFCAAIIIKAESFGKTPARRALGQ